MAHRSNGELVRELYRAIERRDMGGIERLGGEAPFENVSFEETTTLLEDSKAITQAFPDLRIEVENLVEQGNVVMVEGIGRGTHQGMLQTPKGSIQPTGRRAEVRFVDVYQVSDGRIRAGRFYVDALGLFRQLGVDELPSKMAA